MLNPFRLQRNPPLSDKEIDAAVKKGASVAHCLVLERATESVCGATDSLYFASSEQLVCDYVRASARRASAVLLAAVSLSRFIVMFERGEIW